MTDPRVTDFLNHLVARAGLSKLTARSYGEDLKQFAAFQGGNPVPVDRKVVRSWAADMDRQGLKTATVQRRLSGLKAFCRYLTKKGLLDEDPTAFLHLPRLKRKIPNVLWKEDMGDLLGKLPPSEGFARARDRALVELLYGAGLRISELATLDLNHTHLDDGTLRVLGKGGKTREVPLTPRAIQAIKDYLPHRGLCLHQNRRSETEKALFVSRRGKSMSTRIFQQDLSRLGKQLGTRQHLHPHLFRHAYATHLLQGGADLREVQELLGHASIGTTQIYTHLAREDLRQAMSKLPPPGKK